MDVTVTGPVSRPPVWQVGLAIVWAIGLFPLAAWLVPGWTGGNDGRVIAHEMVQIALALALLAFALRVENVPRAALGLRRPGWPTLGWGLAGTLGLVLTGVAMIVAQQVLLPGQSESALKALTAHSVPVILLIAATAGITEEIAYRAVLIDHLSRLTGGRAALGVALSVVLFGASHVSGWGWQQFALVLPAGLVLALLFVKTRDLAACMIAHFLTDALGLLSYAFGR